MADAIVSTVLQQLVTILYEQTRQEVRLLLGVDREIENLRSNFQMIQAVLQDAERRQVNEASVRDWLFKLRQISYDVEDVLDEWKIALLRLNIRQQRRKRRNKVRSFLPSPRLWVKKVVVRHDIGNKIKELDERLNFINEQKQKFGFVIHERVAIDGQRSRTTSFVNVKEVRGREKDKIFIKHLLMLPTTSGDSSSSSQLENVPRVVSIVGMGGIGKTTLAQLVYNDEEVTKHFDLKIWICVSDSFDETRVAKEVFEKCFGKRPEVDAMDIILQEIREYVSKKNFLLVLDDVWTEEIERWDQLMNTLKCTISGSRILVTTRKEKVAMVLGSRQVLDVLHLGILNENDSWLLFRHFAFHDATSDEIKVLEGLGRKIMSKCEGLPLALKILGSHLRFKRNRQEWEDVLTSDTWKIDDAKKELFGPLLLSYYELSHAAKRCFIHCALFPKDYVFQKSKLIMLWMAQGFCGEGKDGELRARECLDDLFMRGFLDDSSIYKPEKYAEMHDIVHDFAMFLGGGEYCHLVDFNGNLSLMKEARHIFLDVTNVKSLQFLSSIDGCEKLRSMHIVSSSSLDPSGLDWRRFKHLRTLKLSFQSEHEVLPTEIGKLVHLRYLDLSGNTTLRVLPEEICDLCSLEALDISGCYDLQKLPQRIGELINLKCLINSKKNSTVEYAIPIPKGITRLVDIKEIRNFCVGQGENDASLKDLGNLLNIEVVGIDGLESINDACEGMEARLAEKTKLKKLVLSFRRTNRYVEGDEEKQEQLLEALNPPSCLENLSISRYIGRADQLPSWIESSMSNLTFLKLDYMYSWVQLPPLGKLIPTLEVLHVSALWSMKKVGVEFLGISPRQQQPVVFFPNLKTLSFNKMAGWEEWDWSEEEQPVTTTTTIMPRLIELSITRCRRLRAIPQQLLRNPKLQKLDIGGSDSLVRRYQPGTGVDCHTISHIPTIIMKYVDFSRYVICVKLGLSRSFPF